MTAFFLASNRAPLIQHTDNKPILSKKGHLDEAFHHVIVEVSNIFKTNVILRLPNEKFYTGGVVTDPTSFPFASIKTIPGKPLFSIFVEKRLNTKSEIHDLDIRVMDNKSLVFSSEGSLGLTDSQIKAIVRLVWLTHDARDQSNLLNTKTYIDITFRGERWAILFSKTHEKLPHKWTQAFFDIDRPAFNASLHLLEAD